MGTHIHTAIGYGMSWGDFNRLTLLKFNPADCFGDEMERLLGGHRGLRYSGDDMFSRVWNKGDVTGDNAVSDLISTISNYDDDPEFVIFYPTAEMKQEWYRFNDDVDWVMAHEYIVGDRSKPCAEYVEHLPIFKYAIPDILRWWLTHCEVFDNDGVAALRPMRAQWWG